MKILMISLDKKILDPASAVAQRMIEYGKKDELCIVVPDNGKKEVLLSSTVHAYSTGGNKLQQYHRLKKIGLELMKKNDIRYITVQDPSFIGNVGRWLKKKTGASLEIQVHGDFYGSNFYKRNIKDFIGYFLFGKRNLRYADQVREVSERMNPTLTKIGVDKRKIVTKSVPISLDGKNLDEKEIPVQKKFPDYEKYFLFIGRLEEVKNVDWIIDIFEEIVNRYGKRFLLLIVGEGAEKKRLLKLVEDKRLNHNIQIQEWTNNPRVYYHSVDCVLMPSLSEGYGLVAMEAHAAGCKVIMNDVGVANYELKPSEKVIILPIDDKEKWIQAILNI